MRRRIWSGVAASAAVLALAVPALLALAGPAVATPSFTFARLAGTDRNDTARVVAEQSFQPAVATVVIARGDDFPDALAGTYVASSGSPILLTLPGSLPTPTRKAIHDLGATHAILIGGTGSIGTSVEDQLHSMSVSTERLAGTDRYDTAKQCAEYYSASTIGTANGKRAAIVASGQNYPDALAGGPLAYGAGFPIVLVEQHALPDPSRIALTDMGIQEVLLLGGTNAVGNDVQSTLTGMGMVVMRIAGGDRTETATKIADYERDPNSKLAVDNRALTFDGAHVNLARGDDYPDALAGGPHAGEELSPVLLTSSSTVLGPMTRAWLTRHSSTLLAGHLFGGTTAISTTVQSDATTAARGG